MGMNHIHSYISDLHDVLDRLPLELVDELISLLLEARLNGRQVFIMGNGGSASTASHFAADLSKNTRRAGMPNFKVQALTDNMAIFSAYANDEGYENVFVQQLASFVRPHDIVIGISASGNSMNVIKAIELANQAKARSIGFTGFDGGKLGPLVDLHVHVPSTCIEQVEDVHLMLEHMIVKTMKLVSSELQLQPTDASSSDLLVGESLAVQSVLQQSAAVEQPGGNQINANRIKVTLEALGSLHFDGTSDSELDQVLQKMLSVTMKSVGASSGSLLMLDEDGSVVDAAMGYEGDVGIYDAGQLSDVAEKGLAGWVVAHRQPVLVPRTDDDPRWLPRTWEQGHGTSRSAVSVPLMHQDKVMGVLTLVHSQAERFTREDLLLLTAIAVFVSARGARESAMGRKANANANGMGKESVPVTGQD